MFTYHSLDFGPKNQTDVLECCRQSNDALDEDKYFVFLTFYGESSSVVFNFYFNN
ncbi:BnaC04g31380D [Brassica napus]|uniref:BnaC04g31380D protein n=1 Tax=Brassica napus TaxID=3708 RepID=A0A078HLY4_BRANA|nr:BnaC04g31380D [Brassica napus]